MKFSVAILLLTATTDVAHAFVPTKLMQTATSKYSIVGRNPLNVVTVPPTEDVVTDSENTKFKRELEEQFGAMPDLTGVAFSGLKGKALSLRQEDFPLSREIRAAIPDDSFILNTATSLKYLSVSLIATAFCTFIGINALPIFSPSNLLSFPFWAAYSVVTGTVAMGLWVLAHECGHGAFSKNKKLQNIVGYTIHSLMLVPYYSWQRSHAVHHKYCNHMDLGETHVPEPMVNKTSISIKGRNWLVEKLGPKNGLNAWGASQAILHLLIGWPAYLLIGATGGPARGMTNHFYPEPLTTPSMPKKELFKGNWKRKVYKSDIGIAAVVTGLLAWTACNGFAQVMALYGGPLLVINAWLVTYTWLQHTDVDVPHFDMEDHNYVKGALHTIDRPYDKLDPWGIIDFLHHRIGSTHVAHHFDSTIPHYKAKAATDAVKEKFPQLYLYDPTPIPQALWRVCKGCAAVEKRDEKWVWNNEGLEHLL